MARSIALNIVTLISLIELSAARSTAEHNYLYARQSPPTTLPDNWSYKGCYTDDVASRSLQSAATTGDGMTAEVCITFCTGRGYSLAGTEYSKECYCGNSILSPGTVATDGCNMACGGAAGEACGGPNRLSVYEKNTTTGGGAVTGPVTNANVGEWGSLGCYVDSVGARTLSDVGIIEGGPSAMTPEACTTACQASNFKYAGVEYSGECYCGNTIQNGATTATSGCDMVCNGNQTEICGGANRINLYEFGLQASQPPAQTGWISQGCYTDSVAARTLQFGGVVQGAMTNEKCYAACEATGYTLAGTEYAGECYCDNQLRNGGGPAPDGDAGCNMACNGNTTEMCGGPNRLSLFKLFGSSSPTETPTPTATVASSTVSRTNTATATASGLPAGFEYKGCYVDGPGFRIMNFQQPDDQAMTIASCSNKCADAGYSIAGMEYSYQCFCDNVIRQGGSLASSDTDCGMNCAGAADEKCGGPDRLSVWASGNITVVQPPKPQSTDLPGNWVYQGCITDPLDNRVFPWQIIDTTNNSATSCLTKCAEFGYMAAGMEYGQECYCGDLDGVEATGAQNVSETECQIPCTGNPEAYCGGNNRLTWYRWENDPIYVWNYPTGNGAGEYRFLVGGPVVPLITQPAINGKISMLEKKGTGPPNSTGAYEFDPSLSDNIFTTFREMQGIKTDIFCAAGLTMPDKAGRQLNVGGWSLESTYGVRIYTPNGVLGTNGTNDWQENYEEIRLQAGRWYPTGMVMANGSILVVGGQSGSNGPPVPSMEILPRVGGVKFADYLQRTDPFNLYPFLVVLPSGGIFILYYNEARITDVRVSILVLPLRVCEMMVMVHVLYQSTCFGIQKEVQGASC